MELLQTGNYIKNAVDEQNKCHYIHMNERYTEMYKAKLLRPPIQF